MACTSYTRISPTGDTRSWQDAPPYAPRVAGRGDSTFFVDGVFSTSAMYTEGDCAGHAVAQEIPIAGFTVEVTYTEESDSAAGSVLFFGAWIDHMAHFWALDDSGTDVLTDSAGDITVAQVMYGGVDNATSIYVDEEFGRARNMRLGQFNQYNEPQSFISLWSGVNDDTYQIPDWTLSFRIRLPPESVNDYQHICRLGQTGGNYVIDMSCNGSQRDMTLQVRGDGGGIFNYWSSNGMGYPAPQIYDDAWHRFTITYDSSLTRVRAYHNRETFRNNSTGEPYIVDGVINARLNIKNVLSSFGRWHSGPWESWLTAVVDEIAIFNRPLSEQEIFSEAYQDLSLSRVPEFGVREEEITVDDLLGLSPQNPYSAPDSLQYVSIPMCGGPYPFYLAGLDAGKLRTILTPEQGHTIANSCPPTGRWSCSGRYYVSGDGSASGAAGITIFDRLQLIADSAEVPAIQEPDDWFPLPFDLNGGPDYVQDVRWSYNDEFFFVAYRSAPFFVVYKAAEEGMRTHFCPFIKLLSTREASAQAQETGSDANSITVVVIGIGDRVATIGVDELGDDILAALGTVYAEGGVHAVESDHDLASILMGLLIQGGLHAQESGQDLYHNSPLPLWPVGHGATVYEAAILPSDGTVATVGANGGGFHLRKYADYGELLWSVTIGNSTFGVGVDSSDGSIVTGGLRSNSLTTRKYDAAGGLVWSVDHGTSVYGVAVSAIDGSVVTAGLRVGNLTTRKYDSAGNLLWSVDHGTTVYCAAVDPNDGSVVVCGAVVGGVTTRKYDSAGGLLWSINHGATVWGVAIDPTDGSIATTGLRSTASGFMSTRKYDSAGNLLWSADHGGTTYGLAMDPDDGSIVIGGVRAFATGNMTTRKYDTNGNLIWSADHGNTVWGAAVDPRDGKVITVGAPSGGITTRKYEPEGDPIVMAGASSASSASSVGSLSATEYVQTAEYEVAAASGQALPSSVYVTVRWAEWAPQQQICALLYEAGGEDSLHVYDFSGMLPVEIDLPVGLPAGSILDVAWSKSGEYLSIVYATAGNLEDQYTLGSVFILHLNAGALSIVQEIPSLHVTSGVAWSVDDKFCIPLAKGVGVSFTPTGVPDTPPYFVVYRKDGAVFTAISDPDSFPLTGGHVGEAAWSTSGRYLSLTNPLGQVSVYEYSATAYVGRLTGDISVTKCLSVKWSPTRDEFVMDSSDFGAFGDISGFSEGYRVWHMKVSGQSIVDMHSTFLTDRAQQKQDALVEYGWSPCGNYTYMAQSEEAFLLFHYRDPVSETVDVLRFPSDYYPLTQTQEVQWVSQSSLHEVESMSGSLLSDPSGVPTNVYLFGNKESVRQSWDPQKYALLVREHMGGQKIPMSASLYDAISITSPNNIGPVRKIVPHPDLEYAVCIGAKASLAPSIFFLNLVTGEKVTGPDPATMGPATHTVESQVHDIAFSRVGARMAVCHGHSLRVYQTSNWLKVFEIDFNLDEEVTSASWNGDGSRLAVSVKSAAVGSGVYVYDATSAYAEDASLALPGTLSGVNYVSYSRDATKLIACHSSNKSGCTVWDAALGTAYTLPEFDALVDVEGFWAAWTPDDAHILIRTNSSPAYRVLNTATFAEVVISEQYSNAAAGTYHGCFSWDADDTLLVTNPGTNVQRIIPQDWAYPSTLYTFGDVFDSDCVVAIPNAIVGRVVGTVRSGDNLPVTRNLRLFQRYADVGSVYVANATSNQNTGVYAFKVAFRDECILIGKHDDAAEGTPRPDRAVRVFPR